MLMKEPSQRSSVHRPRMMRMRCCVNGEKRKRGETKKRWTNAAAKKTSMRSELSRLGEIRPKK